MKLVARAYMRAGSSQKLAKEAAQRNFSLDCLFKAGGRSSETACCIYDSLEWDFENEGVFIEIIDSKKSKVKLIAYVAGADRESDWFVKCGHYLTLQKPPLYNTDEPVWLVPELHGTDSPGKKLGDYLKALKPQHRGGAASYAEFAVKELFDSVNAGGIRPGVSNLLCKFMPAEFVVHVTAHQLVGIGALFEYVDADRALALIGALVLAGWPPVPYGHHADGPKPPSLEALVNVGAVAMDVLDAIIDDLFHLDSASPPMLQMDGALRPMLNAAFASMVMYHDDRIAAGEAGVVTTRMHEAFKGKGASGLAVTNYSEWGSIIRNQFESDNVHLRMGATAVDSGTATVVKALGRTLTEVKGELAALRMHMAQLSMVQGAPAQGASQEEQGASQEQGVSERDGSSTPVLNSSPIRNPFDAVAPSPVHAAISAAGSSAFAGMMPQTGVTPSPAPIAWAGTSAAEYYRGVKAMGGAIDAGLCDQDKRDARNLVKFFDGMANEDEKAVLGPQRASQPPADRGERRRISERLHKLMVARFADAFISISQSVPQNLGKSILPTSAIANRTKELKKGGFKSFDTSTFAQWRIQYEAKTSAAGSSTPAAGSSTSQLSGKSSKRART